MKLIMFVVCFILQPHIAATSTRAACRNLAILSGFFFITGAHNNSSNMPFHPVAERRPLAYFSPYGASLVASGGLSSWQEKIITNAFNNIEESYRNAMSKKGSFKPGHYENEHLLQEAVKEAEEILARCIKDQTLRKRVLGDFSSTLIKLHEYGQPLYSSRR